MRKLLKLRLLALITVILVFSCKKKDPVTPSSDVVTLAETEVQVKDFFDKYKSKPEKFLVNATTGGTFYSKDGTAIIINPDAFLDPNGNKVTTDVDLYFIEYNQPSEMVLGNRPTMTPNGEILESAGEYLITAYSNNAELDISNNAINLVIPVDSIGINTEMEGWSGDTSVHTVLTGYDYQNVYQSITIPKFYSPGILWTRKTGVSVSSTFTSYQVAFDSIGNWANVDVLVSDPRTKTTLLGYFDVYNDSTSYSSASMQPSALYFKPDDLNTVLKLTKHIFMPPAGYAGFLSYQNIMPIGMTGTFLAITFKDNKIYAQKMANTAIPAPATGASYSFINFNLTEVTESEMVSMILSLD